MPTLDLSPAHLRQVLDVLERTVPHAEVWAYGSRVNHTAHEGSDLDLVVRNPGGLEVPQKGLHHLRDALEESNLPFVVEVRDWARIPEEFRHDIERQPMVVLRPAHTSVT